MQLVVNLRRLTQYAEEKLTCMGRLETLLPGDQAFSELIDAT